MSNDATRNDATSNEANRRYELAQRLAYEAGKRTLVHFQKLKLDVELKKDRSPVTIADRDCETYLREQIHATFPDDAIVGEEFGEQTGSSGYRWILDPIDGTKSFISGVPLYGTMVAVECDGHAQSGVVYLPGLDEMIYAQVGHGCWHRVGENAPVPAHVSKCTELSKAKIVTSEVRSYADRGAAGLYDAMENAAYIARTWGDCYGYLLVATGRVDAAIDPIMNIWDAAAVQPIINEAGGRFSDWQGKGAIDSGDSIGSNGLIHEQLLTVIADFLAQI